MSAEKEAFIKALNYSYFFLKFRPRTKKEIVSYLQKKSKRCHFDDEIIQKVVDRLNENDLINDVKFIIWFVDQRNRSKPKSEYILKQELTRFGISKDLINQYFENNRLDEFVLADKALRRKAHIWENLDKKTRFNKSISFLLRRGFSYNVAKKIYFTIFSP